MKRIITLFVLLTTTLIYSQSSGITYQAVLYNPSGEILPGNNNANAVLANKDICLRFSIIDALTSVEYQETQKVKTDEFGMVNTVIGTGSQIGGYAASFTTIVWNSTTKKLQVAIDVTGTCSNFVEISNQNFSAVPFAYASKTAESVSGVVPIVNGGTGSTTVSGAKINLGLNNVDNTSDANKPISTATQTALNLKENTINKSTNTALGTSDVLYPTQNAVKTYVDNQVSNITVPDASTASKGKIKLAGDLGGTADAPTVPGLVSKENTSNKSTDMVADANSTTKYPSVKLIKEYVDSQVSSGVIDATSSDKGKIQLAGDLGGTADAPTVPGLLSKENAITVGTTSQYFRGDKTWQTLDKSVVGLSNVDNTTDAGKPISSATQTALDTKENSSNKSTTTALGTSNDLYPTQNAVKTYVDTQITANTTIATTTATGKIQLAGDLGGTGTTATAPVISDNAITSAKIADGTIIANDLATNAVETLKIKDANVTSSKLADGAVTNAKIGEVIAVQNGGSGANMSSTAGYVKQATTGANLTTVSTIPVADVDGAVRKVNGVVPDANGNVAVIIGRVFTGSTVNPDLATSIINASPAKQQSDIYIVADGSNPNNGRTFIYDGTNWLEVATDLSTTDARYVNVAGDTMEGNLIVPTGIKIAIADAPSGSTDAVNKAYVDGLVTSSATPDATSTVKGKIKLAGDLGGTADAPTVPDLALKAPLESPSLTGTPLAPTAASGTNTTQIATTAFVTTATAGKQDAITLTTSGTGAASLVGSTLNIPTPNNGTVTEVSALTIGTSGTDITSTVANSTTTPEITLNVPTASATNRGALSTADWTTFNDKVGGSGTTNFVPKFTSSNGIGDSSIFDNGTNVGIGTSSPANTLEIKHGTAGNSGLRFTNLTSSSSANSTSSKVLSLNSNGDVVLANVPGTQNIVTFSTATPTTSGVVFTPDTPSDQSVIYQSTTDNSLWTYNGTSYVTYTAPASTAWNLAGTTNDAGNNKTATIWRAGSVGIGVSNPTGIFDIENSGLQTTINFSNSNSSGRLLTKFKATNSGGDFDFRSYSSGYNETLFGLNLAGKSGIIGFNDLIIGPYSNHNLVFGTNNAERMRVANNGNVGIGTSSPANTLEIKQGTAGNSGLRFTNLTSSSSATTSSSKVLSLNNNGDVILTNVPGTQNIVSFSTATPTTSGVAFTPNTPADQSVIYQSATDNSLWTYNGTTYVTYTAPASTAWNLAGTTNDAGSNKTAAIWRSGNIGIATNTPQSLIDISPSTGSSNITLGTIGSGTSDEVSINLGTKYNRINALSTSTNLGWQIGARGDATVGTASNSYAQKNAFHASYWNGSSLVPTLTILPSGNMGIKGITNPQQALDINGTALFRTNDNSAPHIQLGFSNGHTIRTRHSGSINASNAIDFRVWRATPDNQPVHVMTLQGDGNVGIGTTTPGYKLSVIGNTRLQPNTINDGTGEPVWVEIYGKAPTGVDTQSGGIKLGWYNTFGGIEVVRPGSDKGVGLAFNYATTGGATTEGFRLTNAGRVGIGTTAPNSTLEVNGSATNTVAFNNGGSATAIAFSMSNLAYTTLSPQLFALTGIKDGGTYTLAVQGATQGTSTFMAPGFTFRYVNNGPSITNTHTLYTFIVMGTTVYVYTTIGFTP